MSTGQDKKRSSLNADSDEIIHMSAFSTASSTYSRAGAVSRNGGYNVGSTQPRSDSPPASAYFSGFTGPHHEPTPTPGAQAHFAYSTTLRRHHVDSVMTPDTQQFGPLQPLVSSVGEAGGWLKRIVKGLNRRTSGEDALENGVPLTERATPLKVTPSAKYAHKTIEETLYDFQTSSEEGLSSSIVPSLQAVHGYNEFSVQTPEPLLIKFAKTIYESPLILLLFGSAIISAAMGNIDDAVSITIAILIVLTVGFVQERRSEKSLEALNKLVPHHCHLIRDSRQCHMLANELVPGDIVTFNVGDRIPADIRLIIAVDLEIDESSLTGETHPARKSVDNCNTENGASGETVALAERTCVAYMGTLIRNGRGSGVVVGTGCQTEFGVIFSMMQEVEEKRTPLQLSMDELAKKLSILSFGVIGIIVVLGLIQQRPWLEMFTIGVSLAVAAIPEGLPIVTTVTLALGVLRMSRRKAIVKKLPSVEALGSVSVVCSDKTGTLTKNEQTVTEAYTVDELIKLDNFNSYNDLTISASLRKTLEIGCLCNNAFKNEEGVYVGQSTDVALLNVLFRFGMVDLREMFTRTSESPFNSEQKFMAVGGQHMGPDQREVYYIKGSIDTILPRCKFYYVSDSSTPALDAHARSLIMTQAANVASRGLRVLAMAYGFGSVEAQAQYPPDKANLVFAGFQGMLDPPRKGVAAAIESLHRGGVQVIMITGDAEQTAISIARQLGLRMGVGGTSCLTGAALDQMSPRELMERVGNVSIFARTTPRHKMAIVKAFQSRGKVVAMTGDGVNDAPALKMADIGVSMGKSGTDVAKEAADVILVDDNFETILSAVEEGKSIFHNIQNFLSFQLSTAVAALTLITLSTFFRLHNPLNPMQILFINILMDGPPSQSLGVDPVDPAVMRRPPRRKDEPVISKRLLLRVLFSASVIVLGTLFVYMHELSDGNVSNRDQTMTFTCFVFLDLASALQSRGLGCGLLQNRMLISTVSISFVVQLCLIYVPVMQAVFQTEALALRDLLVLLALGGVSMTVHEIRRRYERSLSADETFAATIGEIA